MRLETLSKIRTKTEKMTTFLGYNHTNAVGTGEWYEMQNMTGDHFPVLAPRSPRGTLTAVEKPNGLFAKEHLAYVDGTALYYNGEKVADVTDSDKAFVSMGAYLIVMPDKIAYNVSTDEVINLEHEWKAEDNLEVNYESTSWTGGEVSSSDAETYTYVKISATGIGDGFAQYDGVEIEGCTHDDLNKTAILYEVNDNYVIIIGDVDAKFKQTGGLTIKRKMPDMSFICESENRLWGCSTDGREVFACKLGDPTNWQCYEGITSDSMAITVGSDGDFTGCISFGGYVLFFKEDCLHKLYGSKPSNYQVTASAMRGVEKGSEKSLCIVNEVLYYKSKAGILAYSGGVPQKVSDQLGVERYTNAVAAGMDGKYYVSMMDDHGKWHLFVYDTVRGMWHREDNTHASYMVYGSGNIYYMDEDRGKIRSIHGDDKERIHWQVTSGMLTEHDLDRKYLQSIKFRVEMDEGALFEVLTRYDEDPMWRTEATTQSRYKGLHIVEIYPNRYDNMQIMLRGLGHVKVWQMDRVLATGSEV